MANPGVPSQPLTIDYGKSALNLSDSTAVVPRPSDSLKKKKRKLALQAANKSVAGQFADSNSPPVVRPQANPKTSKSRKLNNNTLLQDTEMTDDAPPGTEAATVPETLSDPAREYFAALSVANTDALVANPDSAMAEPLENVVQPVIPPMP